VTAGSGVSRRRPKTPDGMDLEATADGPALVREERPREYAQWLTCTACAVAWIGMWSQEPCWCCERTDHVRLRWAAAA